MHPEPEKKLNEYESEEGDEDEEEEEEEPVFEDIQFKTSDSPQIDYSQVASNPNYQLQIKELQRQQHNQVIGISTKTLLSSAALQQCLQPLYNQAQQNRIRVSVRLPSNDRYLLMLDKSLFKTCHAFIDLIVDKFSLDPYHYRHPSGFLVKELTDIRVQSIGDINKDDQLVLISDFLIKNYNPSTANPEEIGNLLGNKQPTSYFDIFGIPQNSERQKYEDIARQQQFGIGGPGLPTQMQQQRPQPLPYSYLPQGRGHWALENSRDTELEGFYSPIQGIPPPRKLREKFDYLNMENCDLWCETPDFLVLANDLHFIKNRDELITHLRNQAVDRGFKLMLPYGKPDAKQYVTCSKSGKKKSATSKKSCCPFSLVYKKAYLGTSDPRIHPAFNGENAAEITKDKSPQIGIYYLSKFRGLHNHPLELSYIHATFGGTDSKEKEVQGSYESDALDDLLQVEPRCADKQGKYIFQMRNQDADVWVINPEGGIPFFAQMMSDEFENRDVNWAEMKQLAIELFDRVEAIALEGVQRDFSRKPNVFIYQGTTTTNQPTNAPQNNQAGLPKPNEVHIISKGKSLTIQIPKSLVKIEKSSDSSFGGSRPARNKGKGKPKNQNGSSDDDKDSDTSDEY